MTALHCDVIYTLPLALAYSMKIGVLRSRYGSALPMMPMVEIATRPPGRRDHDPGLAKMRAIVAKRLAVIGVDEAAVFGQGSVDALVRASGGQPRELMHLVRQAIVAEGVPIALDGGVRAAMVRTRRALRRGLMEAHERIVAKVAETGELPRSAETESTVRELLENRILLHYCNDDEWYAPNPLL